MTRILSRRAPWSARRPRRVAGSRRARRRSAPRLAMTPRSLCACGRRAPRRCRRVQRAAGDSRARWCIRTRLLVFVCRGPRRSWSPDRPPAAPRRGRAQSPGARQSARQHRFELADVTERERPPQRPDRRGRHRAESQHPPGAPGAQHPDMIDVSAAREHRGDHRADLGARVRGTRAHPPLDQRRNTQTGHQRARQDQARVGHQALMIKRRCEPVQTARRCRHKKCLLFLRRMWIWTSQSSQIRRPFSRTRQPTHTHHTGGFRFSGRMR